MAAGVRGVEAHRKRLRKLRGPAMIRAVTAEVFGAAQDMAIDAAISITRGATSGKNHEPGAPGEPPNADSHVLDRSITANVVAPLKAEFSADAPYAAAQEFGSPGQNLPERPFMRPAAERGREPALKRIVNAVNRVVSASGN